MDDFPSLPIKRYRELRQNIRSGDILLCSGNTAFSHMIQQATQSVWSHVAFILRVDAIDRIMVLESVESIGVRAVPLSHYVYDYNSSGVGYPGKLLLARHRDLQTKNILNLSQTAVDLLGHPYDTEEIVRIATRIGMNTLGIKDSTQDAPPQHEFICSEYAYICFQSIGIHINYNPLGFISPADFARDPRVQALSFIQPEMLQTRAVSKKSQCVEA